VTGKLKSWLTAIIILAVAAFIMVFEPVTWGQRKQLSTIAAAPRPIEKVGPLRIYAPLPNIRLGLDLQGGSHVVLRARPQVLYDCSLSKPIGTDESDPRIEEARAALQGEIAEALPKDEFPAVDVTVTASTIRVRSDLVKGKNTDDLAKQLDGILKKTLADKYGAITCHKPEVIKLDRDKLTQVIANLERRVNGMGLSEAVLQRQEPDKIIVELPGAQNPKEILDTLKSTAVMEWRHIPKKYQVETDQVTGETLFKDREGNEVNAQRVLRESRVIISGADLKRSVVDTDPATTRPVVGFELTREGGDKFYRFTRTHQGQYLAIVLDNRVISAPVVESAIRNRGIIRGSFTYREATDLSVLLNAGALPVPLDVAAQQTVSASLGKDSLLASLRAGLIGLALVLVFMVAYYRLPGILADVALGVYCLLLLAVLKLFGATLTLPGIAGVILSIGMAVDANVIIFERLKEELRTEKTLKSAIEAGFNRAWTAILDSNVCSIITATVLIILGTAAIKGFAITLLIGVLCSMFTAVTVTRLLMNIVAGTRFARRLSWFGV